MSAQHIYDHAPLGAIIRFSDRTPQPPARFKRKLEAWKDRNACGRLINKSPPREISGFHAKPSITLHMGDFKNDNIVVLVVQRTFGLDSDLDFMIESLPVSGSVRVLHDWAGTSELLHLASDRTNADRWLTQNHFSNVRLEEVGTSESLTSAGAAP